MTSSDSTNNPDQEGASNRHSHSSRLTTDPRLDRVARKAAWDGSIAGLKMGAVAIALSTIVRKTNWSPVYNGLTLQFRVFLHMAVIMGAGFTAAEHSLSAQRAESRGGKLGYRRPRPPSDSDNTPSSQSPPTET